MFIVAVFVLIGCEDSSTSVVKEFYIDNSMTMTTSQLLDNRNICEDVKWNSFEDQHKRIIVEYNCTFINTEDFLAQFRDSYINKNNLALNEKISRLRNEIKAYESEVDDLIKNGETHAEDEVNKINEAPIEPSRYLAQLARLSDQLNIIKTNYSDNDYINFLLTDDFRSFLNAFISSDFQNRMLRDIRDIMMPLNAQVGWMRRKESEIEREAYKKDNVDKYLRRMRDYIDDLLVYLNNQIEKEKEGIEKRKEERIALLSTVRADLIQSNKDRIEEIRNSIAEMNKDIGSTEERLNNLREKSEEQYPRYEKIVENFQWVVNKEKQTTPIYGEVVAVSSDSSKNKVLIKHVDPAKSLLIMSKIDSDDYEEYIKKFSAINFLNFISN